MCNVCMHNNGGGGGEMTKVPTLMMIAFDKLYTRKMNFKTSTLDGWRAMTLLSPICKYTRTQILYK